MKNTKFVIEPHFRLQEWMAEEKGYFKDEGLDYVFQELIKSTDGAHHYKGDKVGAMQAIEKGRSSNVSCAAWTCRPRRRRRRRTPAASAAGPSAAKPCWRNWPVN